MVTRLKELLSPVPGHPWERAAVFNPACVLISDRNELNNIFPQLPFDSATENRLRSYPALVFLLYRAQGKQEEEHDFRRTSLGLAVLTPQLELLARHVEPVLLPDRPFDELGIGDGRLTKIGDRYFLAYTAYAKAKPDPAIRLAMASTRDFIHWEKHGLVKGDFTGINNTHAALFAEKIDGLYTMLHRPMEGIDAMAIHWAQADDLFGEWRTRGMLLKPVADPVYLDQSVFAGPPPLQLDHGRCLLLYHATNLRANGVREITLGAAVADFFADDIIVKRTEPLMKPELPAEMRDDPECGSRHSVFVCGAYWYEGDIYFPYAGGRTTVLGGKITAEDLKLYLQGE